MPTRNEAAIVVAILATDKKAYKHSMESTILDSWQ